MILYHYYDKRSGPFKSLTALPNEEALSILEKIKEERPDSFASQRDLNYIVNRSNCEAIVREKAKEKGIIMDIDSPHYMVIEECPWLNSWYEDPAVISIHIKEFDTSNSESTVDIGYDLNLTSGKVKLVLITPDGDLCTIAEATKTDAFSGSQSINVDNGKYRIKLVAENAKFELNFSVSAGELYDLGFN